MKVIIDLIEDIAAAINNDKNFTLSVMGLKEDDKAEFHPSWQSNVGAYKIDESAKTLFLFLHKDESLGIGNFLKEINALSNEAMMYELKVSLLKEGKREDKELIGFGESFDEKKYLCFITE